MMNLLTKEQCENALENILFNVGVARSDYRTSGKAKEDYHTLNSLIEEHFSNPPLKFEELKEGMWVWDDRDKEYIMVCRTCVYPKDNFLVRKGDELVFISKDDEEFHRMYRPNRFYRKEVQE